MLENVRRLKITTRMAFPLRKRNLRRWKSMTAITYLWVVFINYITSWYVLFRWVFQWLLFLIARNREKSSKIVFRKCTNNCTSNLEYNMDSFTMDLNMKRLKSWKDEKLWNYLWKYWHTTSARLDGKILRFIPCFTVASPVSFHSIFAEETPPPR